MKIKKINEDKVQIIITNQDLEERDVKKWDLMPSNPKAQELFQDLLDMAYHECGFEVEDDTQLMVEAYPLSVDSFVVVMTKVRAHHAVEHFSLFTPQQQETDEQDTDVQVERGLNQVWRFPDLETCCLACSRIVPDYVEFSALYKYNAVYYLAVGLIPERDVEVEVLLGEYGEWVPTDEVFLQEHGTVIIAHAAVPNLASLVK
ncbi:MAG: Negative regulator of tic competence [Peptococcaceae bacterium]|jgi:adapter protein MecA 1/2|nr:Negative regulator of tic competence [Peptococcaceae bacterium]